MSMMLKKRRPKGNTTIVNVPGGGEEGDSTFDASGRWTPLKDASGNVTNAEWNGLPLNTWIQWGGTNLAGGSTRLDQHLTTPFGTTAPYSPGGSNPTKSHYDNFTGAAFDEVNGVFYHFGGGHAGGSNNMLTKFELRKGIHTVVIPPTPSSAYPTNYIGSGQYHGVNYPGFPPTDNYFRSDRTPVGDDKPCASHEYAGMVFVPGLNEVVMVRHSYFHAVLSTNTWRVGPQCSSAEWLIYGGGAQSNDPPSANGRDGIGWKAFYVPSTQRIYTFSSGTSDGLQGAAPFVWLRYNPTSRAEDSAFGISSPSPGASGGTYSTACIAPLTVGAEPRIVWYFKGPFNDSVTYTVSAVNLVTGLVTQTTTPVLGRKPARSDASDGDNPCQYIHDLDTILIWCTYANSASGSLSGEMLNFNRTTKTCSLFTMAGTPPPNTGATRACMNNKMRYWPERKVLAFQTATDINCYLIKLA